MLKKHVANMDLRFASYGTGSNLSFDIDNVLVKKLAEPITNTISTVVNEDYSTASNWGNTNCLPPNYSVGTLRIAGSTAGSANVKKTLNLMQDQLYRITFSSSALSMAGANIAFAVDNNDGTEQSIEQFAGVNNTTASNYTFYIIPRTNSNSLLFNITSITSAFTFDIDNFKIENVVNPANPLYSAVLNNLTEMYSGGMAMPSRQANNTYVYGYGGKTKDNEISVVFGCVE